MIRKVRFTSHTLRQIPPRRKLRGFCFFGGSISAFSQVFHACLHTRKPDSDTFALVDKCFCRSPGKLNPALALRGRQAAPTRWNREACLQLAPGFSSPIPQAKRKTTLDRVVFFCQRAVKRCVKVGKNSKKYTKSKLFNASKKVLFVLRDKRLHICFTCAKRNYTFQKTSVIISPDIYLQGIFGQFLFIWIFILLGFFCKINYV